MNKTKGFIQYSDEGISIYCVIYSSGSFKNKSKFDFCNEGKKKRHRKYIRTDKGRAAKLIANKKSNAKRKRNLGYKPINKPFDNCNGHHLNKEDVIYIPTSIHRSVYHSVIQDRNMKEINDTAFEWLCTQGSL